MSRGWCQILCKRGEDQEATQPSISHLSWTDSIRREKQISTGTETPSAGERVVSAEKFYVPFRIACESKSSRIVKSSVECFLVREREGEKERREEIDR